MARTRLTMLTAALLLVVAAVGALVAIGQVDDRLIDARLDDRTALAVSVAAGYDRAFSAALAELATVVSLLGPADGTPQSEANANELLARTGAVGTLDAVLVVHPDGIVRAADPGASERVGRAHRGPHVDAALAGEVEVGGPEVAADGTARIQLAVPLPDVDGNPNGAVVGLLAPPPRHEVQGDRITSSLVWEDGTVVAAEGPATRDQFLRANAQRAANGPGVRRDRDAGGMRLVVAYARVRPGWTATVAQPAAAFDAGRSQPLILSGAAMLAVFVAAAVAVTVQQRRLGAARAEVEDAKRALLAVAGHELRTPVTVVDALGQTLENRWDDLRDEERRDLVLTVGRHARTLRHLVERLMFAARLAARTHTRVSPREIDVVAVVARAVDAHAALAPTHRFLLDAPEPVPATADPDALDQVLFHLLENAVRFSPGGGDVHVTVSNVPRPTITIQDDGIGLPADTSGLFERFGQVEAVDTRVLGEGGVGLGLYIVRTLLDLQGATIAASNRPTGGARFDVTLRRPT